MVDIDARLRDGWRPAQSRARTWQRGARRVRIGEDLIEDLNAPGTELQAMSPEEEQALIEHRWADDSGDDDVDIRVVAAAGPLEAPDGDEEDTDG